MIGFWNSLKISTKEFSSQGKYCGFKKLTQISKMKGTWYKIILIMKLNANSKDEEAKSAGLRRLTKKFI